MFLKKIPIRLILSVAAGIATSSALSLLSHHLLHLAGIFPKVGKPMFETNLVVIDLILHSIYAIIAAVVTSILAKEQAKKAAFVLGSKEAIMWLIGTILLWKHSPVWYNITKAVLGIPLALLGGKIHRMYKERKKQKELSLSTRNSML